MSASYLGYQAFFKRFFLEDNPFPDDTEDFDNWYYGWARAQMEWEASCEGGYDD